MKYILALLLAAALYSCKEAPSTNQAPDTTLDIRLDRDPARIHPIIYNKPTNRQIYTNIFLPLADFDPYTYALEPVLITDIPTKTIRPDGAAEITLHIRPEAQWPDGSPITAHDYLFTLKAINHPLVNAHKFRSAHGNISSVNIDPADPKRFTVTVDPDYMLALESAISFEIYPRYVYDPHQRLAKHSLAYLQDDSQLEAIKADTALVAFAEAMNGEAFSQSIIVGAGPYDLVSYTPNKKVILRKKEQYWGSKFPDVELLQGGPDSIVFHIVPDPTAATALLKSGDIDLINNLDGNTYQQLGSSDYADERLSLFTAKLPRVYLLLLNTASPQLNEVGVRQALGHLVDHKTIIEVLEGGLGTSVHTGVSPRASYFNPAALKPAFDLAKAQALLDQNGWIDSDGDGFRDKVIDGQRQTLRLKTTATPGKLSADIAQILKADAAKAGIDIELIAKPSAQFTKENMYTGDFHIAARGVTHSLVPYDPYQSWHSDNAGKGTNRSGYTNAELDEVIENIRNAKTEAERKQSYYRFQEIMVRDLPAIYLYSPAAKFAVSKHWKVDATEKKPGYLPNTAEQQ